MGSGLSGIPGEGRFQNSEPSGFGKLFSGLPSAEAGVAFFMLTFLPSSIYIDPAHPKDIWPPLD
jgi:hypothetical protein